MRAVGSLAMTAPRAPRPDNPDEERIYGLHACLAVFRARRQDIRRAYVSEARLPDVKTLLRWCAKNGIAYHVVENENLEKVTRSRHHEGVCLLAKKPPAPSLAALLDEVRAAEGPVRLLLLENVRDPHNVGAIVRSAAHFGARAVLLAKDTARRSSALLRTAEGGAEAVALVSVEHPLEAAAALASAGVTLVATSSHAEHTLYGAPLPEKVCVLFGAEREGLSKALAGRARHLVRIDGTGVVESLNVAAASAVVLAELWRRREAPSSSASSSSVPSSPGPTTKESAPASAARPSRRPKRRSPPRRGR